MALGSVASAPGGYLAFCQRRPDDCGASATELQAARQAFRPYDPLAAIRYDWTGVFTRAGGGAAAPVPAPTLVAYDWSQAFAKTTTGPSAPAQAPATTAVKAPPALTPQLWAQIGRVNGTVNRAILRRSDDETYGAPEAWALPLTEGAASGDCEDFVLEKRRALLAEGVPAHALSIAVVTTVRGQHHAVLLVDTEAGEYVLDNLTPWILPWRKTSYQWQTRQVAGSALHWAIAGATPAPTQPLLLASLR